jgi:hypothetical protein
MTKVEKKVVETKSAHGLCSTCIKDATCTFPRDPEQPVLECEEFEGEVFSLSGIQLKTKRQASRIRLLGYCLSCPGCAQNS